MVVWWLAAEVRRLLAKSGDFPTKSGGSPVRSDGGPATFRWRSIYNSKLIKNNK